MSGFRNFFKKEFMLIIAAAAAGISCLFAPVTNYIDYIDTDVIGLLFCLMIAVAGFRECGVLRWLSAKILGKGTPRARRTGASLVMMTFVLSALFTNDVALIAFVPVTAALFEKKPKSIPYVITVQTVAANLGSTLTPFGNPQNLYLYDRYGFSPEDFFSLTTPLFLAGGVLTLLLCLLIKDEPLETEHRGRAEIRDKRYLALYAALFVLCLLAVFGVLDVIVVFASVCAVAAIIDMRLFGAADYGLLATFALFFIFVGNIRNIGAVREFVTKLLEGREMLAAAGISQVISNVPASIMLSEFTEDGAALVLGTNIGGLGTIVASMASLISLRVYMETDGARPGRYLGIFSLVNFLLLGVLLSAALLLRQHI